MPLLNLENTWLMRSAKFPFSFSFLFLSRLDGQKSSLFLLLQRGSDWWTVSVRRVSDLYDYEDKVEWVKFSRLSWSHDEKGFFYSVRTLLFALFLYVFDNFDFCIILLGKSIEISKTWNCWNWQGRAWNQLEPQPLGGTFFFSQENIIFLHGRTFSHHTTCQWTLGLLSHLGNPPIRRYQDLFNTWLSLLVKSSFCQRWWPISFGEDIWINWSG